MFPGAPVATIGVLLLAGCSATAEHPEPPPAAAPAAGPPATADVQVSPTDPALVEYPGAAAPARVEVPEAGIDMRVVPVGRLPDGSMELPERVDVAGWYQLSAPLEGVAGNTVIAAHVDSLRYGLGPFAELRHLGEGAGVAVTGEGGERQEYRVTSVGYYAKHELPVDSIFLSDGRPQLVLITCGGEFDSELRRYSDNIVVTATPI